MPIPVDIFLADPIITTVKLPSFNARGMAYVYRLSMQSAKTDAELLEETFRILNIDHPPDYRDRSLSVGDIVTINRKRSYRCDWIGWERLHRPLLPRRGTREAIHWLRIRKRLLRPKLARVVCRVRGCALVREACRRCHAYIYGPEFLPPRRWLARILDDLRRFRRKCAHRCIMCRRYIWFSTDLCCTQDCSNKWFPF